MNKAFFKIIAILFLAFGLSCAPKPKIALEPAEVAIPTPYDLKAIASNGRATLSWKIDRPAKFVSGGYNIYLIETNFDSARLCNRVPYPGDTDGDASKETFEINDLVNGRIYRTWIRMLTADGALGPSSETLNFVSKEVGQLTIYFDMLHDSSGYSFAKRKYTKARDYDNDFYLYEKDGVHISSPSLYSSLLRTTDFTQLSDAAGKRISPIKKSGKTQSIKINSRYQYQIITSNDEWAAIKIENYLGSADNRRAVINYTFLPAIDLIKYYDEDSLAISPLYKIEKKAIPPTGNNTD